MDPADEEAIKAALASLGGEADTSEGSIVITGGMIGNTSKYTLNDGKVMPVIGFGTYRISTGSETYNAVATALQLGYRMIDTAEIYRNQGDVGRACRDSGILRSELFVTSKLWDSDHGYENALRAGRKSANELGLDYIDLYLIHSPGALCPQKKGKIIETWDALHQLQKEGLVRSVGVSNFGIQHLEALEQHGRPLPAVNQFELHPFLMSERGTLVEYCRSKGILVQPYGSVLSGHEDWLRKFKEVAEPYKKTAAQVLLRWALQQGFQVIPKSTKRERITENLNIFDFSLSQDDMSQLAQCHGGRLPDYWNPVDMDVDLGDVTPKF